MDYETAIESTVSLDEAIRELGAHGILADYEGGEIFDCVTGETIANAVAPGEWRGSDVLAWLGY